VLARTPEEVLAARGVKPTLSPNLNVLALVEVRRLAENAHRNCCLLLVRVWEGSVCVEFMLAPFAVVRTKNA
jgi:hypothetical protein